jgi:glycosyltransferase involved in cell wall biosynthesis
MPRILILSGIQLSTNPRVSKEASALAEAGYDVEVVGATLRSELADRDSQIVAGQLWKYTTLANASSNALRDRLDWQWLRGRRRLWREAARFGVESAKQVSYTAPEMLQYALSKRADLTIVHNPAGVWVGTELVRRGYRIGVDVEDWYSEDLDDESGSGYPVRSLRRWEGEALRGAAYATAPSETMAKALAQAYQCPKPAVVYNAFSRRERETIDRIFKDRVDRAIPSICWFSQVLGPGRGLETLMDSLQFCTVDFEIHLRGTAASEYRESLVNRAPENWRNRIRFHPQAPHTDLCSRIAEHDIGLALEIQTPVSHDLTISNKLLFYLLAGLPVVASETQGQLEAAEKAKGAIWTFPVNSPLGLASRLNEILADAARVANAKASATAAGAGIFSWEQSARVLLRRVAEAIAA